MTGQPLTDMPIKRYTPIIFIFLFFNVSAQDEYPFKYFNEELDYILEHSSKLANVEDFFWRAKVLNAQDQTPQAIALLEKGIVTYDTNTQLKQLLADYYYQSHQYSKALNLYASELQNIDNFFKTITILDFQNKYRTSIDLLHERLTLDTCNVQLYQLLGDNYLKLDSLDQAINWYQSVIHMDPNNQKYAFKLAALYNKTENYNDAIAICDSVISKDSTSYNFVKLKGIACFKLGEYELASECFESLLSAGDSSAFVLKNMGISKSRLNETSEAKDLLRKAYSIETTDYEITYFLSKCYTNSAELDSVLFFLNRTQSLISPDSTLMSIIYIDKAKYYHDIAEYHTAVKCYINAHSYKTMNSLLFHIASINEFKLNNREQAIKYYEAYIENVVEREKATLLELAHERVALLKKDVFFEGNNP